MITGRVDAGAFLARLVRLDPAALVRLRPLPSGAGVELWAALPFRVLVTRVVAGKVDRDATYAADDFLQSMTSPNVDVTMARRDDQWRTPLPPATSRVIETLPAGEVLRVAAAARETLRAVAGHGVGGRQVGERAVRDALLDHVPIVVTTADGTERVDVPQRLVQGLVRMGFIGALSEDITNSHDSVTVRVAAGWLGLVGAFGSAWYRPGSSFRLR